MSEPTVVDARLDKLEQDNRRLKLTVGALLLVMAAVPLIGAVMPQEIPDAVRARSFEVIDYGGNIRFLANTNGVYYATQDGTTRSSMDSEGIFYRDRNKTIRAEMKDTGFWYYDANGIPTWRQPGR